MTSHFTSKDNEFVAWYPCALGAEDKDSTWKKRESAFYVHIPFCSAICDYCGFSVSTTNSDNIERYINALAIEIERYKERLLPYVFTCGHIGGGTPSVLNTEQLSSLTRALRLSLGIKSDAEFTIEANPLSLTREKCERYKDEGINRLSLGIQSFDQTTLSTIGRPHKSSDVFRSIDLLTSGSFRNFSLDIIYGVPGQSMETLQRDLELAVQTGAPHLSCFRLEIIPFTKLKLREGAGLLPPRLTVSELDDMDDLVNDFLCSYGYHQYGVFNYCKTGYESLHNLIAFGAPQRNYVGFGNSAYSYINDSVYCNQTEIEKYVFSIEQGNSPISHSKLVTSIEEMGRFFILGLKMLSVSKRDFSKKFGVEPEIIFGIQIERLVSGGYLEVSDDKIACTRLGIRYINNVCKEFYTGENIAHPQHLFTFSPTITQKQVAYFLRRRNEGIKDHAR